MKCTLMAVFALFVLAFFTMVLWNWLVPDLFRGPLINYWQSLGLLVLTRILTWGFTKNHSSHSLHTHSQHTWKNEVKEKLASLDPEEREAFKQKIKQKWCSRDRNSASEPGTNV